MSERAMKLFRREQRRESTVRIVVKSNGRIFVSGSMPIEASDPNVKIVRTR